MVSRDGASDGSATGRRHTLVICRQAEKPWSRNGKVPVVDSKVGWNCSLTGMPSSATGGWRSSSDPSLQVAKASLHA